MHLISFNNLLQYSNYEPFLKFFVINETNEVCQDCTIKFKKMEYIGTYLPLIKNVVQIIHLFLIVSIAILFKGISVSNVTQLPFTSGN